ncbi:GTP-binding protein Era, partial [Diplonema papillatum]
FCKVQVVGWSMNKTNGSYTVDSLITVASAQMKEALVVNLADITHDCLKAARRHLKTTRVHFNYHFSVCRLDDWQWENPYGHFKPEWNSQSAIEAILNST